MSRYVIDTNVPIVANGRPEVDAPRPPSIHCRVATIQFLQEILERGTVIVDFAGAIEQEYRTYLNPSGQPGVGDRFYREVLNSAPRMIERIELPRREDGEYVDLPQALIEVNFDPSDRKFAALARREQTPVANAVDSDWLSHRQLLQENGISVRFICGCDSANWFAA